MKSSLVRWRKKSLPRCIVLVDVNFLNKIGTLHRPYKLKETMGYFALIISTNAYGINDALNCDKVLVVKPFLEVISSTSRVRISVTVASTFQVHTFIINHYNFPHFIQINRINLNDYILSDHRDSTWVDVLLNIS